MSLLGFFRRKALSADPAVVESLRNRTANMYQPLGGTNVSMQVRAAVQRAQAATYAYMYSNQPAVRTVVDLIAGNVCQLGLKLYERVSDTERRTASDHPAALSLRYPNAATPADQFIAELTADWCVYNNAYALKFPRGKGQPLTLVRLLPHMVAVLGIGYAVTGYRVYRTDGSFEDFEPERMIHWRSYNPADARLGISPLETLRAELVQDSASQAAATELATNGLTGGFIKRPLEAPEWSEEAQERFTEGWRNARKASPRRTPVLDEGMEFVNTLITPKDAELLKSREFTLETVARLYGVPVEMFFEAGDDAQAVKRFYSDVLAPVSKKLAGQLDHSILQAEFMLTDYYYEFDLNEKLRGDPVERFAAITSAVGAPWLLRNEARSMENKPPVDGGDELITPLNVLVGDNPRPAPNIMPPAGPQRPRAGRLAPGEPATEGSCRCFPGAGWLGGATSAGRGGVRHDPALALPPPAGRDQGRRAVDSERLEPAERHGVTEMLLDEGKSIAEVFEQVRAEASNWASDIDRARVLMVAQGLSSGDRAWITVSSRDELQGDRA